MIKYIFWDIDETLIHTSFSDPNQEHIHFKLGDGDDYYTIVRPCSKRLIEFSRNLVGEENVFVLTAATKDYACKVNELAEFGFKENKILSREDIRNHRIQTAYGGSAVYAGELADKDNVLIDNLNPRHNSDKISFLGLWKTLDSNYFQIRDYYGTNFINDTFESDVMNFLERKNKE